MLADATMNIGSLVNGVYRCSSAAHDYCSVIDWQGNMHDTPFPSLSVMRVYRDVIAGYPQDRERQYLPVHTHDTSSLCPDVVPIVDASNRVTLTFDGSRD